MNVSAVVLAGGKSERFGGGRDKLLAEWKGLTLIEHVLAAVTNARLGKVVTECVVAAPATATRVKSIAVGEGCRVVNPSPDAPISASLKAAIAALAPGAEGAVVLLADQPMVTGAAIEAVVKAARGSAQALVRAYYRGYADKLSHPVYIGRYHFGLVHQTEGDQGFAALAEKHSLRWTEAWLEGDNPDIDLQADLDRLRSG